MNNIGKILGGVAFIVVLAVAWFFQQGGLSKLSGANQQTAIQAPGAPNSIDTGTPTSPSNAALPVGYKPDTDALKGIVNNGLVRVSVENPSAPFYDDENGGPAHGFNVDFARLLFADPSFNTGGKQVTVDMHHEVDTYVGVPKQLLATDANGNRTVDIAMDGLTFSDNTPPGVVYSIPYVDDFGYALIVRNGSPIHTTTDLAGKRVGILKGDPNVREFVTSQYPSTTFVEEDDADPAFIQKSVDSGAVDAFIYDYPFAVDSIKGTDLQFAITKLEGSTIQYKIGVRAQDQSLRIYLDAAIAKVKQSPAYLDLLRKYFVSSQTETHAAAAGERTYAVRPRDTLNLIAASQLGDGQRYRDIQKRNNLANPNLIMVGQKLVIPSR
ncbi:transporter substrate-binding and LysM peptidoglycan-binding domain-containing protein [Paraburkholderia polaris]|jgi:ABC-type amino acid transport substrate-binding protein|uniref:transporter substrate-binding and LysM peptidoglycan-binding domain-containing protein n=1 Tax=Paraburkholderia polaris TaxID=2728848 RepID=UPI00197ECC2B|nr:transporter substrate-binding domain-containing protein [Paraburkholderia polaris]